MIHQKWFKRLVGGIFAVVVCLMAVIPCFGYACVETEDEATFAMSNTIIVQEAVYYGVEERLTIDLQRTPNTKYCDTSMNDSWLYNSIEGSVMVDNNTIRIDIWDPWQSDYNDIVTTIGTYASYATQEKHTIVNVTASLETVFPLEEYTIMGYFEMSGSTTTWTFEYTADSYILDYYWIILTSSIDMAQYCISGMELNEYMEEINSIDLAYIQNPNNLERLQTLFANVPKDIYIDEAVCLLWEQDDFNYSYNFEYTQEYMTRGQLNLLRNRDVINAGAATIDNPEALTSWLARSVAAFFDVELMPFFTLGGVLVIIISFSIVLWWLKVFAGG